MAVLTQYTNNGNGTIDVVILWDNINKVKADALLLEAARYAYNVSGVGAVLDGSGIKVPFDNLTAAQKLQVIGQAAHAYLVELARVQYTITQTEAARVAALAAAPGSYDLA